MKYEVRFQTVRIIVRLTIWYCITFFWQRIKTWNQIKKYNCNKKLKYIYILICKLASYILSLKSYQEESESLVLSFSRRATQSGTCMVSTRFAQAFSWTSVSSHFFESHATASTNITFNALVTCVDNAVSVSGSQLLFVSMLVQSFCTANIFLIADQ